MAEAFESGIFQFVAEIANGTARLGTEVSVAYGRRPRTPSEPRASFDASVELIPLAWGTRRPSEQLHVGRELRTLVRDLRPDVVHLHSSFAGFVGSAALAGHVPCLYTPHCYAFNMLAAAPWKRRTYARLEQLVARRVAVVACVSLTEAHAARAVANAPRVAVVRNGIPELDVRPHVTRRPKAPLVVVVGRITAQKSPEACARIAAAIADVARVVWVGSASEHPEYEASLAAAGVEVTGWVDRRAVLEMLRRAAISLHWSSWDGLSFALLDAIAMDSVVVASDIPPNREVVGETQVAATEADATAMIRRILRDADYRDALLRNQRARGREFGSRRMIAGWTDLYAESVARESQRSRRPRRRISITAARTERSYGALHEAGAAVGDDRTTSTRR